MYQNTTLDLVAQLYRNDLKWSAPHVFPISPGEPFGHELEVQIEHPSLMRIAALCSSLPLAIADNLRSECDWSR